MDGLSAAEYWQMTEEELQNYLWNCDYLLVDVREFVTGKVFYDEL